MVLTQIWQELPEFLKPAISRGEGRNTGNFTGRHPRVWLASFQGVVRTFNCQKKKKKYTPWYMVKNLSFHHKNLDFIQPWRWLAVWLCANVISLWGFPGRASEFACQCRRLKRHRFDPGLERSPGVGNDNPLQYSCLENSMDRGAWWATVHGGAELDTTEQLSKL